MHIVESQGFVVKVFIELGAGIQSSKENQQKQETSHSHIIVEQLLAKVGNVGL